MKKLIINILFGKRIEGIKLVEPKKFPIRELEQNDYNSWCSKFKVSSRVGKHKYN